MSDYFPVYWFWATVWASTRDNRYNCALPTRGHVKRKKEGGVLRLVEEGEKENRKTKENLQRYSEEGFGTNRSG